MILTVYYVTATFLQSWRIRKMCTKIAEKLAEKSSVVFYVLPSEGNDVTLATSELCMNRSQARISDFLWLRGNQRGCCLMPPQTVHLGPWVSFPSAPNLIPFECARLDEELHLDEDNLVYLLLETDIAPTTGWYEEDGVIRIEQYGRPIAWKVDSHFAVVLESDLQHFSKFVMATFMQNSFEINDHLPLIRIESVEFEGKPQPFEQMKNHLRKQLISRAMRHLSEADWEKHLSGLRSLSVLANQATEFEYKKNRTEGKTGIVKPDLIPSTKITEESYQETPMKKSATKIEARVSPMKPTIAINENTPSPTKTLLKEKDIISKTIPTNSSAEKIDLVQSTANLQAKPTQPQVAKVTPQVPKPVEEKATRAPQKTTPISVAVSTTSTPPVPTVTPSNIPESNQPKGAAEVTAEKSKPISETISAQSDNSKRPSLRRTKGSLQDTKPPNILIYSESAVARDSTIRTLKEILESDTYTIYPLTLQQAEQKIWIDNTCLLVICGTVDPSVGSILLDYFLRGGKMISLCSDILHIVLPTYRTAEVRENEIAQFSYGKWQKVKMMHHIFCYQPSPVKKHFSTEYVDDGPSLARNPALLCPRSVEMKDLQGDMHNLDVKVLGTEETWNTPSLLVATNTKSGGKAVFSQVHLEAEPSQFESEESNYAILKSNEKIRLEIFNDLLDKQLGLATKKPGTPGVKCVYKNAYFLGRHEAKFKVLENLKSQARSDGLIQTSKLGLKFCGKGETPPSASTNVLPILIHSCPDDFSTVDYFDNLRSNYVGRLVIYAPIVSSSMHVVSELTLANGIAVIPRQQTDGSGRGGNQWLSPAGCAMFSLQLHIPLESPLGMRIPLLQHLLAVGIVNAILKLDGYGELDIGLKWPNDIYANGVTKIGGLLVTSMMQHTTAIVNTGCAINLDNSTPTVCINDLIRDYNRNHKKNLPLLSFESTLAQIFNEVERLIDQVQNNNFDHLYELYYKYWLHGKQQVIILDSRKTEKSATIIGIDDYGYLEVKLANGKTESVQPDGNSFDMLKGLILPK